MAQHYPDEYRDPDGVFYTSRFYVSSLGYNTNLVKPEDAPKSFADLLDPKWAGKIVKAHPGYSGTIMTSTFQVARALGWEYFEKLAKQRVMQVQSSTEPPEKAGGRRARRLATATTSTSSCSRRPGSLSKWSIRRRARRSSCAPMRCWCRAPNPNAARLFQSYLLSREGQQVLTDFAAQHSAHPQVTLKPAAKALRG